MTWQSGFLMALAVGLSSGAAHAQLSTDTSVSGGSVSVGASIGGADLGASAGGTDDANGGGGDFGADVAVGGPGGRTAGRSASVDGDFGADSGDASSAADASGSDSGSSDGTGANAIGSELAATDSGGSAAATASVTADTADVNGDGRLTLEDLELLSPEERLLLLRSLSKRDFRRLARGCRHAGLEAELRGACAYFSDYLR